MNIRRLLKHLFTTDGRVRRAFPPASLAAIEQAIQASEADHLGEIRFVAEAALDGAPLIRNQSARQRAIDVFSELRVWDTEHNNGLLIYLLLADHAVEIVADRGLHAKVGAPEWGRICRAMEAAFREGKFTDGVLDGVQAVTLHLVAHFPAAGANPNELPDRPVLR
ncbi:TPM domain-containing protein [Aquabacterium sp.]|uniref:TPM domain-containing protein n=1 Tax=Aquabacterium sp. TaxID=1872578 RepID=UPI002C64A889|nr:TPM domain-containing protein [Aquabacterium sp.]HSW04284.1 TPM domain-containing protein [Aquabacterium sp.]